MSKTRQKNSHRGRGVIRVWVWPTAATTTVLQLILNLIERPLFGNGIEARGHKVGWGWLSAEERSGQLHFHLTPTLLCKGADGHFLGLTVHSEEAGLAQNHRRLVHACQHGLRFMRSSRRKEVKVGCSWIDHHTHGRQTAASLSILHPDLEPWDANQESGAGESPYTTLIFPSRRAVQGV